MPKLLHVDDLSLSLADGTPVIDGFGFEVAAGESVGLIGPSGCGKSLTTHALLGLLPEAVRLRRGTADFQCRGGETVDLLSCSERRRALLRGREIALIFQEPQSALNPVLSCGRQLLETIREVGGEEGPAEETAQQLLEQVGLAPLGRRVLAALPGELSGGQLQRLLIAMALAGRPRLLIADEPTTSLDALTEREIIVLLDRLRREHAMGMLFIAHDPRLIRRVTDRQVQVPGTAVASYPVATAVAERRELEDTSERTLSVEGLRIGYGEARKPAIRDCSFHIRSGEWVGLIGPSGCGKSTLAGWLVGLQGAQSGRLRAAELELPATLGGRQIRQATGAQVIFQDVAGSLNPRMTIGRAISEVLRPGGGDDVRTLLRQVDLPPDRTMPKYPNQLSGGQRQRVAIARALAAAPRLLICDEAFSGLDLPLRMEVLALLRRVCAARKISVLLITHDLETALECTDTVLLMEEGEIVERGRTSEVFGAPTSELGRRFAAARNW
ncbi:ATP-binding cassette domain-containing protein [Lewinella sp. IMCC34183]|uniref:ATP-binding cassette domain-containing protein n=1 Tax=Lewinella sp. IMCC34183 TaxID=2248762 RepID=UPI000E27234C|nr:ATP-binding cassette domain-containing protein [Lewinella sp. IMCC34183]